MDTQESLPPAPVLTANPSYAYMKKQNEVNLSKVQSQDEILVRAPRVQKMTNVNVSQEGAKPVGSLGLKKAEKELIMRRYKYNHQMPKDHLNRVAMIYGQPTPTYASYDRTYIPQDNSLQRNPYNA